MEFVYAGDDPRRILSFLSRKLYFGISLKLYNIIKYKYYNKIVNVSCILREIRTASGNYNKAGQVNIYIFFLTQLSIKLKFFVQFNSKFS